MWPELLMTSAISCLMWSSVPESGVGCVFTSLVGLSVVCLWLLSR